MTAEHIIVLVPVGFCTLIFLGIGLRQWNSQSPVGFWSGVKPPKADEITNIPAYNRAHGGMWMLYGIGILLSVFIDPVALFAVVIGGLPVLMLVHRYLEKKYRIS